MHWKIKRDKYYSELYSKFGLDFIIKAGFLYDTYKENVNIEDSLDILCTHIPDLTNIENPVILLTTGSFAPLHEGHITMMNNAKQAIEQAGKTVVAGYISPSHDEYVSTKILNDYKDFERISIIEKKINKYNWLFVDPWESIFCKAAINFTDVIERLEKYICKHTGKNVPIYYVCGGDNAKFALTFAYKGNCIVVNRPSIEYNEFKCHELLKDNNRIIWADGNSYESSTEIRKQGIDKFQKRSLYLRKENVSTYFENKLVDILTPYFNSVECANYRFITF